MNVSLFREKSIARQKCCVQFTHQQLRFLLNLEKFNKILQLLLSELYSYRTARYKNKIKKIKKCCVEVLSSEHGYDEKSQKNILA
jgi:hypothetical protein